MNKILIISGQRSEREALEQALQEVVEGGAELFVAEKRGDALEIIKNEVPQLVFLDAEGVDDQGWDHEGVHVVWIYPRGVEGQAGKDCLHKPLKPHQVLEKCRASLIPESVARVPPRCEADNCDRDVPH